MKLSFLAILILAFPLIFAIPDINTYGFRFSSIYFFLVAVLASAYAVTAVGASRLSIPKRRFSELILLMILFLYSLAATNDFRYSKPSFFLGVITVIFVVAMCCNVGMSGRQIKWITMLFLLFCFLFILAPSSYTYDGRYYGFLLAPTVLSVNADAFLALGYSVTRKFIVRALLVALFMTIVFLTRTRINLLVTGLIPLLFFVLEKGQLSRQFVIICFLCVFLFVYPLYQFAMEAGYFENFLMLRYSENRDASFDMRYYLHAVSLEIFQNGSWIQKLLGHGSEFSRLYILALTKEDSYSHNDFLRLLIDFGIIFTILYLLMMAKIASKSHVATILFVLYLSSFYHNMAFDFFLPCLIILSSNHEANRPSVTACTPKVSPSLGV